MHNSSQPLLPRILQARDAPPALHTSGYDELGEYIPQAFDDMAGVRGAAWFEEDLEELGHHFADELLAGELGWARLLDFY